MSVLAVTGGIGSGKSTVCRILGILGAPVYDTDMAGRRLLGSDPAVRRAVEALVGPRSYVDGEPDRGYIASKVFADRALLESLNGIVHPAVEADFRQWYGEMNAAGVPYVVLESAILFESRFDALADRTLTVSAPEQVRLERTVARDGTDRERVRARLRNQMTDEQRERRADTVLHNDGVNPILGSLIKLHELLCNGEK